MWLRIGPNTHRRHNDGNCRSGILHGNCGGGSPQYQEIDIALNQLRDKRRKSIAATFSRTVFDNKVYPLDITELLKALPEGVELRRILSRRYRFQHADPPHLRRLLRAGRERPRRRAAERSQEYSSSDVACHVTLRLGVIHAMEGMILRLHRAVSD
jgi:hypothetical protein